MMEMPVKIRTGFHHLLMGLQLLSVNFMVMVHLRIQYRVTTKHTPEPHTSQAFGSAGFAMQLRPSIICDQDTSIFDSQMTSSDSSLQMLYGPADKLPACLA